MIILVEPHGVADAERHLRGLGLWTRRFASGANVALSVSSSSTAVPLSAIRAVRGVVAVLEADSPHPALDAMPRMVRVGAVIVGGDHPVVCAGPCSVESESQIDRLAGAVAAHGGHILRGGVWKPRTSPHGFQGVGAQGLDWLVAAGRRHGLAVMTEVVSERDVDRVAAVVDAIQVGARSMHSQALLRAVGAAKMPVVLKRAFSASLEEWLLAGEALLMAGAAGVIFCERGVRGPDGGARNVLDVGAIAVLRHAWGLPVLVDPSHAAGRKDIVIPLARAGLAAGAVGVVIEVHDRPAEALSDAPQAVDPALLAGLGQ